MDLASGWFAGRPRQAAVQLERAAAAGFGGVSLLPGDPPLALEGLEPARRKLRMQFPAAALDALLAPEQRTLAAGAASADPGRQERAWAAATGALQQLSALGARILILAGGADEGGGRRERGERVLARLRSGERVRPGDEALEEALRAEPMALERQWESLARFLFRLAREAPGLHIALAPEASPAGLLTPGVLHLLLEDPALAGVGYWHDTAAAEARAELGLDQPGAWLDAFGRRTLGASLHDYAGGRDRLPPGQGKVDWRLLREYLPASARRVLSLAPSYPVGIAVEARTALGALGLR